MDESDGDFDARLRELRQTYLARCRRRVQEARGWLEEITSDAEAVARLHALAHELAGSGATYGFPGITVIAGQLERQLTPLVEQASVVDESSVAEILELVDRLDEAIPDSVDSQ